MSGIVQLVVVEEKVDSRQRHVCILDCLQYTDTTHKISLKNCKNLFASGDGINLLDAHIIYDHHRRQVSHRYDYFGLKTKFCL